MKVLRWLGFVVLLVPAGVGVFFSLFFAGISVMGFDAPGSEKQVWPYLLMLGAWLNLPLAAFLLLYGLRSMVAGSTRQAYLCLAYPAALAGAFLVWMRFV